MSDPGGRALDEQALGRLVRHARAARRLRLEVPGLIGNDLLARRIEHSVAGQEDVEMVSADPRSGRVLITYREGAPIFDRLAALKLEPPPTGGADRPTPAARRTRPSEGSFHDVSVGEALVRIGSSPAGLTAREAARRLRTQGGNELDNPTANAWYRVLGRQFLNLPTGLLLGASVTSLVLGDVLEAGAIALVIGVDAAIGYAVERRSEAMLAAWRALQAGGARVLRDGQVANLAAREVVCGDVLLVQAGDVLPADARVIEADRLACDEAALTGEAEARGKGPAPVEAGAALGDRSSMVYAGTAVATGRGRAVVTATGWQTEVAKIRALLEGTEAPKSPIEVQLAALTRRATGVALGAAAASALAGIARGRPVLAMVRNAVALGVAAIPEGLPLVATSALADAMLRLRESGVIVRRVAAAEALGSVTVVCADKTGTLTRNKMELASVDPGAGPMPADALRLGGGDPLRDPATRLVAGAVLNSDVDLRPQGEDLSVSGSSTEQALVVAAQRAGLDVLQLREAFPRRALREREEGVRYVKSLHDAPDGGRIAFVKGAPEQVLELCDGLDAGTRAEMSERNRRLAADGLRVLAVAWQRATAGCEEPPASGYTFAGLLALRDPLRDTAPRTAAEARRAGIRTVIVTGDQRETAAAIARELGLEGEVLDGAEAAVWLGERGPAARERLGRVAAFTRVTPADKLAIVQALRAAGEVVAMVGDGVNDAPALKAADVGVAVSRRSTDLARQTADVVLDGEDLAPIITAVAEGRILRDNLTRAVRFLFATNLSEVALVLGGAVFGVEPLGALQLLWINLLTDAFPALGLALARGDRSVLARPPVAPGSSIFDRRGWGTLVRDGLLLGGVGAIGFVAGGPATAFAALPAAQLGYALACRAPAPERPPAAARLPVATVVGASFGLHALAVLAPPLRAALRLGTATPASLFGLSALALPWLLARRS